MRRHRRKPAHGHVRLRTEGRPNGETFVPGIWSVTGTWRHLESAIPSGFSSTPSGRVRTAARCWWRQSVHR